MRSWSVMNLAKLLASIERATNINTTNGIMVNISLVNKQHNDTPQTLQKLVVNLFDQHETNIF